MTHKDFRLELWHQQTEHAMKASQKLIVEFENYKVITRFADLDAKLLPLAKKLELNGDRFGPVTDFDGTICIAMRYADSSKDPVSANKIFGYPENELMAMQYK